MRRTGVIPQVWFLPQHFLVDRVAKHVAPWATDGQGLSAGSGVFRFEYERQRHSGLEQVENLPELRQGVHAGYRLAAAFVSFGCDVVVANQAGAEQLEVCVV